ncbi:MAG: DUF2490 domain-containing protein [Bacteroidetes bacterium]|nr:MAG: DUF2490 domain-containing protein [Bacteroidota bacterium]
MAANAKNKPCIRLLKQPKRHEYIMRIYRHNPTLLPRAWRRKQQARKLRLRACVGMLALALLACVAQNTAAQGTQKVYRHQNQAWVSLNSTIKVADKWALLGDVHVRRNQFLTDPNFYFLRAGGAYFLKPKLTVAAGYAHMWLAAPTPSGRFVFGNENRVYQQLQWAFPLTKNTNFTLLQRIRNEQRWQQKIVNGSPTSNYRFTNRVRYLASVSIPVFKSQKLPKLMLANELLLHFGKEVQINAFDQNRLTIGIQQRLSKTFSFDFGYMHLVQRKIFGYQYDVNHTLRLFFYYNGSLEKQPHAHQRHHHSGEE